MSEPRRETYDEPYVVWLGLLDSALAEGSLDAAAEFARRALEAWTGDWSARRQNGYYRVTMFEPSYEWMGSGSSLEVAVNEAAHHALDRQTGGIP